MFRRRRSVAYFAHDPSHHRLLQAPDADDDGEFTCDGCQVVGAGPRYLCDHPGCGFKLHEVCARRFPRSLKSIVHSKHRLKRRESAGGGDGSKCEVCEEDVKGACYGCDAGACASAAVVVHPLCVHLPPVARGSAEAHPGGHDSWLVQKASEGGAASTCAACGRGIDGAWRYRCGTCREDVHPRCLVPAVDQCRGGEASTVAMGKRCCLSAENDVIGCLNISYYCRGSV
ncbi:uncharacterized protein LOC124698990 [Lolium rigidum]|uniref:uncharacterized protein LOC124698990 n=1 Tax=Lolium rigidum TaxID=89674 RepID=UPI001F5DF21D|nr:uncharacterized protein LOC124698990 [Lolium rigidum]